MYKFSENGDEYEYYVFVVRNHFKHQPIDTRVRST